MEKKVLGVIPARGGSKGLPGKNIMKLGSKSLIGWVAEAALKSDLLSNIICSTDDETIKEEALNFELKVPYMRPKHLATDDALIVDVLKDLLQYYEEQNIHYDYIVLIQATSPFTRSTDIDKAIQLAFKKDADTVICGYSGDQLHPSIMFYKDEQSKVNWYHQEEEKMINRQDLKKVLIRCGNVYVVKSSTLSSGTLYGEKIFALEIPRKRSISIDDKLDFLICETLINHHFIEN